MEFLCRSKLLFADNYDSMIEKIIESYSKQEGPKFQSLGARFRAVRLRGYMSKEDLIAVCNWKSPRARPLCLSNHGNAVIGASRLAFFMRDEEARMQALIQLNGVSVPMASAILTSFDPKRYGVIDIRVWQALHHIGHVKENPRGTNLRVEHWLVYLEVLRKLAMASRRTVREAEQALFYYHAGELQKSRLYSRARINLSGDNMPADSRCRKRFG